MLGPNGADVSIKEPRHTCNDGHEWFSRLVTVSSINEKDDTWLVPGDIYTN